MWLDNNEIDLLVSLFIFVGTLARNNQCWCLTALLWGLWCKCICRPYPWRGQSSSRMLKRPLESLLRGGRVSIWRPRISSTSSPASMDGFLQRWNRCSSMSRLGAVLHIGCKIPIEWFKGLARGRMTIKPHKLIEMWESVLLLLSQQTINLSISQVKGILLGSWRTKIRWCTGWRMMLWKKI